MSSLLLKLGIVVTILHNFVGYLPVLGPAEICCPCAHARTRKSYKVIDFVFKIALTTGSLQYLHLLSHSITMCPPLRTMSDDKVRNDRISFFQIMRWCDILRKCPGLCLFRFCIGDPPVQEIPLQMHIITRRGAELIIETS